MRRIAFIVAILALIACGLGSVQADAASASRGQAATAPPVLLGGHCVTVHSNVNHRTGTICVYLARQLGGGPERGEVIFTAHSGLLKRVSVQVLRLSADSHAIQTSRNVSKAVIGISGGIMDSWWDEQAHWMQVGTYNACMYWTDGGKACTGPHWLYSETVRI